MQRLYGYHLNKLLVIIFMLSNLKIITTEDTEILIDAFCVCRDYYLLIANT